MAMGEGTWRVCPVRAFTELQMLQLVKYLQGKHEDPSLILRTHARKKKKRKEKKRRKSKCMLVTSVLRSREAGGSRVLASKLSLLGEFQASEESLSQKTRRTASKERHRQLSSDVHMHTCEYTQAHGCVCAHTEMKCSRIEMDPERYSGGIWNNLLCVKMAPMGRLKR